MLDRLREWWNRPDPMTNIILFQLEQTHKWIDKWFHAKACARVWKQAAKKGREDTIALETYLSEAEDLIEQNYKSYKQAQATADRRLRLMMKQDKKIKVCQFCFRHLKWDGIEKKMIGHADDCEWGKEIRGE